MQTMAKLIGVIVIAFIFGFLVIYMVDKFEGKPDLQKIEEEKTKQLELDLKIEKNKTEFAKVEARADKEASKAYIEKAQLQIQLLSVQSGVEDKRHGNRIEFYSIAAVIVAGVAMFFLSVIILLFFINANQERERHYRVVELNALQIGDRHFDSQKRLA